MARAADHDRRYAPARAADPLGTAIDPDKEGNSYQSGTHIIHAGDELLSGWLFTLEDEKVEES